jgi:methylated-DNA-[protein]-cysteine S-methyltransferase
MSSFYEPLESPLGTLYLVHDRQRLLGLRFQKPEGMGRARAPEACRSELRAYFQGSLRRFSFQVAPRGSSFELQVWLALRDIPYGETRTYKWLAAHIGHPRALRAVGQALARNPLPIVLPCHRVIFSTGRLGGYSQGQHIKRRLLEMEYYFGLQDKVAS